jgi:hypothetical protein
VIHPSGLPVLPHTSGTGTRANGRAAVENVDQHVRRDGRALVEFAASS